MDLDAAHTNTLTDDQKAALMKDNKCFYCQKKGHRTAVCYKKKCNQGASAQAKAATGDNTTPDLPDIKAFNIQQLADLIKDYVGSFSDNTKLDLVEKLLPKDFGKALN